ncbi:zinc-dependent metalloprotease [Brevibacterium sp. 50QC2O2]|uniref:zinc-dependent metalloprotease n=1 Tax=Brevibacterium sp. 50QC2O2 TaxID=2968459 RepID=UPI00211BACC0|nr:zinc-dependent metalloprotease [Brevibacterium sp. 50QC2O2]MCQ9387532.1 zinc-dependent metalloprotease [Brevibacterium sp. 50QC2O2]
MTDRNEDKDRPDDENNPFGDMFAMFFGPDGKPAGQMPGGMPLDPAMLGGFMQNLQNMMGAQAGPDTVIRAATGHIPTPDPTVSTEQTKLVEEAFRLAELWLGQVIDSPATSFNGRAFNRRTWVEQTAAGWLELTDAVKTNMTSALTRSLGAQVPEEMRGFLAGAQQIFGSMGAQMFATQLGQALGNLSGSVLTGTEYGLPVTADGAPALIAVNLPGAAASMGVDDEQLRLYLAVMELAHIWLYSRAPYLAGHISTVLAKYASNIEVDLDGLQNLAGDIDPGNFDPAKIQEISEQIGGNLFRPQDNPAQRDALESLDVLLSTIAGWVEVVTYEACKDLPQRDLLRAGIRERLSMTSTADQAFEDLLGLRLQPTRIKDASTLFGYLQQTEGAAARDAVFTHLDDLPQQADLDDPLGYRERRTAGWEGDADFDAALYRLLDEEGGGEGRAK